jgi:hypothetical protein
LQHHQIPLKTQGLVAQRSPNIHDVDEVVLLSDRIVMMTNGPAAHIGEILDGGLLTRPPKRLELVSDPAYIRCREAVLKFHYERHRFVEAPSAAPFTPEWSAPEEPDFATQSST